MTGATIAWQSNVIGTGKVEFVPISLRQTVQDALNITDHALEITNLRADTQ